VPDEQPAAQPPPKPRRPSRPRKVLPVLTENRLLVILIVVVTVFAFTALAGLFVLAFAADNPHTEGQKELSGACKDIVKVAMGALVGLVGGFAARPTRAEVGPAK
jgi:flagellar basal body-associated protein FliL